MADMVPGASMDPNPEHAAGHPRWRNHAEGATSNGETAPTDMRARAGELLPAQLLQPNEIIVLLLKPSPWFILLAPLRSLSILVLFTAAMIALDYTELWGASNRDLAVLGFVLIGLRIIWQFLEWLARVYVLTDQRVIRVKGVLRVQVFETRLDQVEQTELLLSLRERLFALGTITFATAGTALVELWWTMVARPLEVHQRVVETINRYSNRR